MKEKGNKILIHFHRNKTTKKNEREKEARRMEEWPSLKPLKTAIYHQIKQILYDTYFTTDI